MLGSKGRPASNVRRDDMLIVVQVVSLTAGEGSPFKAGAEVHPSFLEAKDAVGITIPLCVLPSQDEPADEVQKFSENLKTEKYIETFGDQVHGWMGAR